MLAGLPVIANRMGAITVMIGTMIAQDTCHNGSLPIDEQSQDFCLPPQKKDFIMMMILVLADIKKAFLDVSVAKSAAQARAHDRNVRHHDGGGHAAAQP